MDKLTRIIYTDAQGRTCIFRPMQRYIDEKLKEGLSIDEIKKALIEKDVLPYAVGAYHESNHENIPQDRYFRDAWEYDGKKMNTNMVKAIPIHLNHLRQMREPLMQQLDKDFMIAIEKADVVTQAAIAKKKQALRDVTKDASVLNAKTPEELKAAIPSVLKEA